MNTEYPPVTKESIWADVPKRRVFSSQKEGDKITVTYQVKGDAIGEVSFVNEVV